MRPSHNSNSSLSSHGEVQRSASRGRESNTLDSPASQYPTSPASYDLKEICGRGSSSKVHFLTRRCQAELIMMLFQPSVKYCSVQVYRAVVKASGEEVAVKLIDMEVLDETMVSN